MTGVFMCQNLPNYAFKSTGYVDSINLLQNWKRFFDGKLKAVFKIYMKNTMCQV